MKRTLLCALAALACACSAENPRDRKIIEAFEKHSFELHDSGRLAAELRSRGPAALKLFDPRAALLGGKPETKIMSAGSGPSSTGLLLGPCGTSACVLRVLKGSPADRAGAREYERIVSAGGSGPGAEEVLEAFGRGAADLVLAGRKGEKRLSLLSSSFRVPPVFGLYDPVTGAAYIRLAVLSKGAAGLIERGLASFKAANPRKIILDLRYNPGGLPDEAAAVFRLLSGPGNKCFSVKSRHEGYSVDFPPSKGGPFAGRPLSVLVNSSTAMAAEALAAALKEGGASVYGAKTAGSASISRTFALDDKAFLKLSVARFYSPSGAGIEGEGVSPSAETAEPEGFEDMWRAPAEALFFRDAAWLAAVKN